MNAPPDILTDVEIELIPFPGNLEGTRPKQFFVPRGDILGILLKTARPWEFGAQIDLYNVHACGGSYLEVGANIGTDTVHASDFFKTCYAFEPSSRNVALLERNLELNGVTNVQRFQVAVGEQSSWGKLYLGTNNNVGGANLNPANPQSRRSEEVEIVTLDEAMPPDVRDVTYMHIDTEGHDIQVLKGASEFLSRQHQRPLIRMEFQPRALQMHGSHVSELIEIMERFEYTPKFNASGPMVCLSNAVLSELFTLWLPTDGWIDILLCP